jgi:hypothetical protein
MGEKEMRTTEAAVKEIMATALTETEILPFLTTANALVTAHLGSSGLSDTLLAEIEKYLAAHFASIKSKYGIRTKIGEADTWTGYKGGAGLDATPYGETAKMLDTTSTLENLLGKETVGVATFDFALDDDD